MDYLQYHGRLLNHYKPHAEVLNLVINGLPSIQKTIYGISRYYIKVLNLVINGLPSIPTLPADDIVSDIRF